MNTSQHSAKLGRLAFVGWWLVIVIAIGVLMQMTFGCVNYLVIGLFLLPACWQRMNDAGLSPWLALLSVLPLVNLLYWVACMVIPPERP